MDARFSINAPRHHYRVVQRMEKLEDFRFCSVQNAVAKAVQTFTPTTAEGDLTIDDIFEFTTVQTAVNSDCITPINGDTVRVS